MALLGDLSLTGRKLVVSAVLVIVIKLLLDAYIRTKSGLLLAGGGRQRPTLVTTLAKDRGTVKILGAGDLQRPGGPGRLRRLP